MRFGIYGGSFDPIHNGHLAAARAVRAQRRLERVLLVPAARPPHKGVGPVAGFEDRLAMARLATEGLEGVEVLDLEGRRAGPSFTVDTVRALRRDRPEADFDLLVGADMLEDLPRWHEAGDLVGLVTVVAFARPGVDRRRAVAAFEAAFGPGRHVWVDVAPLDVSGTEIRRRLRDGRPLEGLLPPPVFTFIASKRLYGARKGG